MDNAANKQKKWSKAMVVCHWLTAMVVAGLLMTGLSRMTILNPRTVSQSAISMASQQGHTITSEASRAIGFAVNGAIMNVHFILGYSLATLVVFRIILFFTGDRRVFKMAKKLFQPGFKKHKPFVNILYIALYAGIVTMAITGLSMRFGRSLGFSREVHEFLEETHVTVMYGILTFVVVHLVGVFWAENSDQPGVTSSMMSGVGEEDDALKEGNPVNAGE